MEILKNFKQYSLLENNDMYLLFYEDIMTLASLGNSSFKTVMMNLKDLYCSYANTPDCDIALLLYDIELEEDFTREYYIHVVYNYPENFDDEREFKNIKTGEIISAYKAETRIAIDIFEKNTSTYSAKVWTHDINFEDGTKPDTAFLLEYLGDCDCKTPVELFELMYNLYEKTREALKKDTFFYLKDVDDDYE